jgi:DNA-directed RNA polymerase specialized sigma24 family protein
MTVDQRVAAYACDQWPALIEFAAPLCDDPDRAEDRVLATLAWVAGSPRLAALTDDDLDGFVRRQLVRVCIGRPARRTGGARAAGQWPDVQLMQVVDDLPPVGAETLEDRIRRAIGDLPPRLRAAVVLTYRREPAGPADLLTREQDAADLLGGSVAEASALAAAGLARLADVLGPDSVGPTAAAGPSRAERIVTAALAAAAIPEPTTADPTGALEQRARRLRRQQVGAAAVGAVVVLAALGAVFTQSSHPHASAAASRAANASARASARASAIASSVAALRGLPHPFDEGAPAVPVLNPFLLARSPSEFATAVTAGGGYLWTIEIEPTQKGESSFVVQRDPTTDKVVRRFRVSGADNDIGYGDGQLWAWSSNNYPKRTVITTIDVSAGNDGWSSSVQSSKPSIAIANAAFTPGTAWLTEPAQDMVRVDGGDGAAASVKGARYIAPSGPQRVVVGARHGAMRELPSGRVIDGALTGSGRLSLVAPAPAYGLWLARGRQLLYQRDVDAPVSVRLTLPHNVFAVVGNPAGGVYVALHSNSPLNHDPYLVYYSARSLASGHPRPSVHVDGELQVESMVADPAGGVVYTTNQGSVVRWDPTG